MSEKGVRKLEENKDNPFELSNIVWIHIDINNEESKKWVMAEESIPENISKALFDEDTRPRLIEEENGMFVTLRGINFNENSDIDDMVVLQIWIEKNKIITIQNEKVRAISDMKENVEKMKKYKGNTTKFMVEIIKILVERTAEVVFDLYEKVDETEDDLIEMSEKEFRANISSLRRNIVGLRRFIVPQKDVLMKLPHLKMGSLDKVDKNDLREMYERMLRVVEDLNAARERAMVTQEEFNGRVAEQMNKTMYILSIVATLFLPLSFLTGLLGINVGGLPGIDNKNAFFVVCVIMVALGIIEYIWFKW